MHHLSVIKSICYYMDITMVWSGHFLLKREERKICFWTWSQSSIYFEKINPLSAEQQRNVICDLHNEIGLLLSTKHETTKQSARLISSLHIYVPNILM